MSGIYQLPILEVGHGPRRSSCALYGGCLARFLRATWRGAPRSDEPAGRCPPLCSSFDATPPHVAVELAHAFGKGPHPLAGIDGEVSEAERSRRRRAEGCDEDDGRVAAGVRRRAARAAVGGLR